MVLGVVIAVGCFAGCGSPVRTYDDSDEKVETKAGDSEPVGDSDRKKYKGWRWKGKRGNCYYMHESKCFKELSPACKAAGCSTKRCNTDNSAPTKVSCDKKKG